MPVEYLLVDVPAGMPKEPHATFNISKKCWFPTENRTLIGELQVYIHLEFFYIICSFLFCFFFFLSFRSVQMAHFFQQSKNF